jgi:predicted dehydrogenase
MLRVAVVGCGKIADAHASQIQRLAGAKIVAAFDSTELMARQFCDRFSVESAFSNLGELINKARPDVIHITTPPQSHFSIAKQCIEGGCHVYVEKPFTLDTTEARKLIDLAGEHDRKLTTGHDAQFTHVACAMRKLIRDGYLGGAPVHMESTYCYNLGNEVYASAFLSNQGHWLRSLPGKLLQNVISHGVAKIAEHIHSETPKIIAHGFVSPLLRRLGEREIIDELRVIIDDQKGVTAYFTFSSQMHPPINRFRVYGPKNGLIIDEAQQTLIRLRGERYKSYGERFIPAFNLSRQYFKNFIHNVRLFLKNDFHFEVGKRNLIEAFYSSIQNGTAVPIPYREILLTSHIMDEIFTQISVPEPSFEKRFVTAS